MNRYICVLISLTTIYSVNGDITIYSGASEDVEARMAYLSASFGPNIPGYLMGLLVYCDSTENCSSVQSPPSYPNSFRKWILLMQENNCKDDLNVRLAQDAGYDAVIIHAVNSSGSIVMQGNSTGIDITAVSIGLKDGLILKNNYLYDTGFHASINYDIPLINILLLAIPTGFGCFICIARCLIFIFKFCKDRCWQASCIRTYKEIGSHDRCTICLESYQPGETLKVLPCTHSYHPGCIDRWLTPSRRECPMCKRTVPGPVNYSTQSSSNSDDETQSLLGHPSNQVARTFTTSGVYRGWRHIDIPADDSSTDLPGVPQSNSLSSSSYHSGNLSGHSRVQTTTFF